ncbi:MAG: hypothetical protein CUN54_01220 [Phototrophicales bacterium]|nr:MAG: hypothetical protein CUN54_01220 [Phototrophicales bacterium]
MDKLFGKLLVPPKFEDENETRVARLLHTILVVFLALFTVLASIAVPTADAPVAAILSFVVLILIVLAMLVLLRHGHVRSVSIIFVAISWIYLTGVNVIFGGTLNPGIQHYTIVTLMAGLLINGRAALVVAVMSVLAGWGFHFAEVNTLLPESQLSPTSIDRALSLTTNLTLTALLLYLALNSIDRALRRAQTENAERKWMQIKLEEERNLLRTLIDNLPDLIYVKDLQSRFVLNNKAHVAFMGASSPEELIGKTDFDYHPTEDAATYLSDECRLFKDGKPLINKEETSIDHSGKSYWHSTSKIPLRDHHGNIIGLVGISRDITMRKEAEAERMKVALERKRIDLLKEFVNNVSHDLKTPLTIIKTSLYLLERWDDPVKQHEKMETIKHQVHHLERLIQNILTVSRLERLPHVNREAFDLSRLINEIIDYFRPLVESKQITLEYTQSDTPLILLADESLIERALMNLIENAIHYTDAGGTVGIEACLTTESAIISVCDTGVGIDSDEIDKIFESFYRGDRARTGLNGSAGLGLSIVKQAVELHQGVIDVDSTPGEGSTFTIRLPLTVSEAN